MNECGFGVVFVECELSQACARVGTDRAGRTRTGDNHTAERLLQATDRNGVTSD